MYDTRLPFGARKGCSIFHCLSQSVKRMMERKGFHIVVYLDDFLIVASTYEECLQAQHVLISLLAQLGFFIIWHKVLGPSLMVPFLGIVINTNDCSLSMDNAKLSKP